MRNTITFLLLLLFISCNNDTPKNITTSKMALNNHPLKIEKRESLEKPSQILLWVHNAE